MSRELRIFSAQPNDLYFVWQLKVQLHNLRKYGLSSSYTALIWKHSNRKDREDFDMEWKGLQKDFPETNFVFYEDNSGELDTFIKRFNYIPLLRPWLLGKYFKENPSLKDDAILYIDSDVIFTKEPDFLFRLKDDDINYLSDTKSYISASYFDSKEKDVLPEKVEGYKNMDVLDELLKEFGLNREVAMKNQEGSGGAQYLLKNIDSQFWQDVFKGCMKIRVNLTSVNRRFFESENKGFQSWCADMWSILFNLWKRGNETACPPEMDFAWATDFIDKWDRVYIYHDAGDCSVPQRGDQWLFNKRSLPYVNNERTPFDDDLSFVSKENCSWHYARAIENANWMTKHMNNIHQKLYEYYEKKYNQSPVDLNAELRLKE